MTKRKSRAGSASGTTAAPAKPKSRAGLWLLMALAVAFSAAFAIQQFMKGAGPSAPAPVAQGLPAATYIGASKCAYCHASEQKKWSGSQHAAAMMEASEKSVRGDFANAKVTAGGVTSAFTTREGRYFVRTDGPDGKLADFEVKYTFGVEPLQQYLVEMPGGRLQALGLAWDTRDKDAGGQRWFHLQAKPPRPGDPLHWTGLDQNWNYQCADCHSTNVRKNYDSQGATFKTSWSEINVACESCHGPGSNHVAWAKKTGGTAYESTKGLTAVLDERRDVRWTIDAASGNAARSKPRATNREVEVCARCHARRGQFSEDPVAGQPLHDAFRPALLDRGLYYPDGQQRDEVYNYGSFLQSRMHAHGVTCSDCHEPHTQKLRSPGNEACSQCHAPAKYAAESHHHHRAGSKGSECAACHMPTTTYMVVDPRHDHSFRIPRPDRTISMGAPNACNACHRDMKPEAALESIRGWFPKPKPGFQDFAEALHAGDIGAPGAQSALRGIVNDRAQPAIARASAIQRLAPHIDARSLDATALALNDADPNVRMAATQALARIDSATKVRYLARMLSDSVKVVRIEAANAIAGAEARLDPAQRAAFDKALGEFLQAQQFNADRPESHAAMAALARARGETALAIAANRMALKLDPSYFQAAVNLVDILREQDKDVEGEAVLLSAIKSNPDSAPLKHAMGLLLVREKRLPDAMPFLADAARFAPGDARYAYVFGIALYDLGKREEGMKVLAAALARHPYDREILIALGTYERTAGRNDSAASRAKLLRELEPGDPEIERVAKQLEGVTSP